MPLNYEKVITYMDDLDLDIMIYNDGDVGTEHLYSFKNKWMDYIYYHWFPGPTIGWNMRSFVVTDWYDANASPALNIVYENYDIEYRAYLNFHGDKYREVTSYYLYINDKLFIEQLNINLPITYILNMDEDGLVLPKSEEKFIAFINRLEKLRALI
jgi:hypothetical protein